MRDVAAGAIPLLRAVSLAMSPLPAFVGNRVRTWSLRGAGLRLGKGTLFWGVPTLLGGDDLTERLTIGTDCGFNVGCFFDVGGDITIGNHVSVGHHVMILSRSWEPGTGEQRAGVERCAPVVIEDGAWLGARCTIMPGVRIGAGAVIGASVVVTQDVPAQTLIMGSQKISLAKWR